MNKTLRTPLAAATCCHEESSVAIAHELDKIEAKPLAILAHGTVGLQHAAMAIYNAWCERVPVHIVRLHHRVAYGLVGRARAVSGASAADVLWTVDGGRGRP